MKLGTETASLVNHIYSTSNGQTKPEIGMGCTVLQWSDRQAATVISIEGNIVTVQEDLATRTDKNGMSDMQDYDYAPNIKGATHSYRMNKAGRWEPVYRNKDTGRWNKQGGGSGLLLGRRDQYRDFSF